MKSEKPTKTDDYTQKTSKKVMSTERNYGAFLRLFLSRACPTCKAQIASSTLSRTMQGGKNGARVVICWQCYAPLRFTRPWCWIAMVFLTAPLCYFATLTGAQLFAMFDLTNTYREARQQMETNLLGFVLTVLFFFCPSIGLSQKLYPIEEVVA